MIIVNPLNDLKDAIHSLPGKMLHSRRDTDEKEKNSNWNLRVKFNNGVSTVKQMEPIASREGFTSLSS